MSIQGVEILARRIHALQKLFDRINNGTTKLGEFDESKITQNPRGNSFHQDKKFKSKMKSFLDGAET